MARHEMFLELSRGVEIEQAALGVFMAGENRATRQLPALEDYIWADPCHRDIYATVRMLRERGRRAVSAAVHASMPEHSGSYIEMGGIEYLAQLASRAPLYVGEAAEDAHITLLRERIDRQRLIDLSNQLLDLASDPQIDTRAAIERVWADLDALRNGDAPKPLTYRQLVRAKVDSLGTPVEVYSTGIEALDDAMQGGLWPGKLYGIAARMKCGKSLLLGTIAHNLAKAGVSTLYLTLEMGPEQVTDRMAAADLGVNALAFLSRTNPHLPAAVERYAETAPECLLFEDRAGITFNEMRSLVGRYLARYGIRVFVLDYWQLVQGAERGETEAYFLGRVAQWLADVARSLNIVILTAAQINREGQTRGGDGLRLACSMYLHQRKVDLNGHEQLYMEMEDSRYTPRVDIGSEEQPKLFIDRIGPAIRQWGR